MHVAIFVSYINQLFLLLVSLILTYMQQSTCKLHITIMYVITLIQFQQIPICPIHYTLSLRLAQNDQQIVVFNIVFVN